LEENPSHDLVHNSKKCKVIQRSQHGCPSVSFERRRWRLFLCHLWAFGRVPSVFSCSFKRAGCLGHSLVESSNSTWLTHDELQTCTWTSKRSTNFSIRGSVTTHWAFDDFCSSEWLSTNRSQCVLPPTCLMSAFSA
jgi:hypothetical protein